MLIRLAIASLRARILAAGLTAASIALSIALILGVENIRNGARNSFFDTIHGTDLIIGARSGSVQLLLYSVFGIGNAPNNMSWKSYQEIASRQEINWIVPISLGDSHRQFRVMGTTPAFFEHYRYRGGRPLSFSEGRSMTDLFDTVIGSDVARSLNYNTGDEVIVAHGLASFSEHEEQPFTVVGVIEKTGTPIDRTVIVSLDAISAIHVNWQGGEKRSGNISDDVIRNMDLTPDSVTAALIGLDSRLQLFHLQRWINEYPDEPLLAVLPGLALRELWQIVGVAETALMGVSALVVGTALVGMVASTFASLNERRREMAILRAIGARPSTIIVLLMAETWIITISAIVLGTTLLYGAMAVTRPWLDQRFGIWLPIEPPGPRELAILACVIVAATIASVIPALRAYSLSVADGITVKT